MALQSFSSSCSHWSIQRNWRQQYCLLCLGGKVQAGREQGKGKSCGKSVDCAESGQPCLIRWDASTFSATTALKATALPTLISLVPSAGQKQGSPSWSSWRWRWLTGDNHLTHRRNEMKLLWNFSWLLFGFVFKGFVMYKFIIGLISMMSFLNTHQPVMFNVYVHILTVCCPFCFSNWTLEGTICLWCTGQTAENDTEHIFDEWTCWFMLQIGSVLTCVYVWVCVCLLKWEYLFWWKMQKVSWINNGRNFWCLSSWPN